MQADSRATDGNEALPAGFNLAPFAPTVAERGMAMAAPVVRRTDRLQSCAVDLQLSSTIDVYRERTRETTDVRATSP